MVGTCSPVDIGCRRRSARVSVCDRTVDRTPDKLWPGVDSARSGRRLPPIAGPVHMLVPKLCRDRVAPVTPPLVWVLVWVLVRVLVRVLVWVLVRV